MLIRVLMVGDSLASDSLNEILSSSSDVIVEHQEPERFWAEPGDRPFDLALARFKEMPPETEFAVQRIKSLHQSPEIVILGADLEAQEVLTLQGAGCFAVVPFGLSDEKLAPTLTRLVSRRRQSLRASVRDGQEPKKQLGVNEFVTRNQANREVLRIARRVAVSNTSLLLLGETGVGKEWLARAVHAESPRSSGDFIAVNCGAIPENLLESELFGHEKGAFTGATRTRRGYFEQAHGGTLFLDEIGEMSAPLQVRLLRVLQDRTIQRLGSEQSIEVDTRVIAATHRDVKAATESGEFRQDLYYRLAVVSLTVPALRERAEDIPYLANTFCQEITQKLGRSEIAGITDLAIGALGGYSWPGNIRELINVIERAALLCDGYAIDLEDLPPEIAEAGTDDQLAEAALNRVADVDAWIDQPFEVGRQAVLTEFERGYFKRLLERNRGHMGRTAEQAGIDPRTLYNKMRQLGLEKTSFKS